jgi:hypothetical protein
MPAVPQLEINQKYGQRALKKAHSMSYCTLQSEQFLGRELSQRQDSLHMQAYPTQLQDSLGSPGISLREREQERELAQSDGFLTASCEFSPRFSADMSTANIVTYILVHTSYPNQVTFNRDTQELICIPSSLRIK